MRISHWMCPTKAGGPGNRLMLWLQGCRRACPGCISPNLQPTDGGTYMTTELLAEILSEEMKECGVEALTLSGGEPLDQIEEVYALVSRLKPKDCLLYTGYSWEEAQAMPAFAKLKPYLSVIITDPYVETLNDGKGLRGSSNQRILVLKGDFLKQYKEYGEKERPVEYTAIGDEICFTGLPS
ncbi:MAG: radical SAM protein [Lachnospiraceae bacterium]|nr:radical SAM protein [Lachnospiraceae bacterium]